MRLKRLQLLVGKNKLRKFKKIVYTIALLVLTFFSTASPILAATFTAGMAKRDAPGPFTGAPIVQGKWDGTGTSDGFTNLIGTQISGNFYSTLDKNQGSIVLWLTPEWGGTEGKLRFILSNSNLYSFRLFKDTNNRLYFQTGNQSVDVDISSWTAGSTYSVVARWDRFNTLDGTKYLSISINDSHTFGGTSTPLSDSPQGTTTIGQNANALIEGLTIYRRPLFDGTYGIDVGNGDEIASIYNSGSGKDPTLVTGSWDVVFALPTNSSTGALTTGTGNAWTHPHLSNLLYTSTTNTGGFMMNGTYTSDGWTDEGTPTSVSALATSEKIFAGGYKTVSDAANEGIYYDKTVTAGNDWVVRALAHSDGTSIPKIILYDQTNGAEIGSLTGTTTSTRTDPDVFIFTGEAPAGMTTLRVKLVNTATSGTTYWHQVEVLSNRFSKPSFETGSGDPWLPTGWSNVGLEAGDSVQELTVIHSGLSSYKTLHEIGEFIRTSPSSTDQKFYAVGIFAYINSGSARSRGGGCEKSNATGDSFPGTSTMTGASWNHYPLVYRYVTGACSPAWDIGDPSFAGAGDGYIDDIYSFQLTDVSLTVTPASEANSTENTDEIRVDGRDTYVSTSSEADSILTTSGYASFNYRPRHSAADAVKFAETTSDDAYIVSFAGDSDDYINVYWDSSNTVKMDYSMAGTTGTSTWDATGVIAANTEYSASLTYTGGGSMVLNVGGTDRITLSSIPSAFGTAPNTINWGSDTSGGNQGDATFSNFVFDITAPSISLTALSPDPTSDNTPTLTGTATDAVGTVASVEFQVDSTAGSWSSCTADDGTFDEASEAFSCTPSALSDGSHTMYVRATDNVANTTPGGSESSDVFTVDTAGPLSITLDSPGSGAYVTTRLPTFRFKVTTDGSTSISKYEVVTDFGTGSAINVVGDINSGGSDVDTSEKYINYDGEYVEVRSKVASKELSEGDHTWRVIAYDSVGNTSYSQRSFVVDFSSPALEGVTLVDSLGLASGRHILTATKPKITGSVTDTNYPDHLVVNFTSQVATDTLLLSESLYLTQTLSFGNSGDTRVTFEFFTSQDLPVGKYKVDVSALDKAGNSSTVTFLIEIVTSSPTVFLNALTPFQTVPTNLDTPDGFTQMTEEDSPDLSIPALQQNAKQAVLKQVSKVAAFLGNIFESIQDKLFNMGQTRLATFVRKVRFVLAQGFADVFGSEPTKITKVELAKVGSDYVVVTWETNNFTINNKVNLGEDLMYGKEAFGLDYTKKHKVEISELSPQTTYYFEVMSQGKNYTFDAYYSFETGE